MYALYLLFIVIIFFLIGEQASEPYIKESLFKIGIYTSEGKKFVPNKKGDIGMEVYYLCQPNTYVIAREFGEQQ